MMDCIWGNLHVDPKEIERAKTGQVDIHVRYSMYTRVDFFIHVQSFTQCYHLCINLYIHVVYI